MSTALTLYFLSMGVYVNQNQTAQLVGCSRNNFSKMWKKEKDSPGAYSFFSESGKIDISDPEFIEAYGNHMTEHEKKNNKPKPVQAAKPKPKKKPAKKKQVKKKQQVKKVVKKKPAEKKPAAKQKTVKQQEQVKVKEDKKTEKQNAAKDEELKSLTLKASKAEKIEKINKAQRSEIELKKARADLVEIESLAETCIGYLSALNQNVMNMPTGFIDEFDSATKTKKTRSERIDILTTPICTAISETKQEILKELEKSKRKARSYETKNKIKAPSVDE